MTTTATIIRTLSKAATVSAAMWYLERQTNKALHDVLSANNVKGRSKLTKKEDMVYAIMHLLTSGATLRSAPAHQREPLNIKKLADITDDNELKDTLNKYTVAELKAVLTARKVKGRSKITKKANLAEAVTVLICAKNRRAGKVINKAA